MQPSMPPTRKQRFFGFLREAATNVALAPAAPLINTAVTAKNLKDRKASAQVDEQHELGENTGQAPSANS